MITKFYNELKALRNRFNEAATEEEKEQVKKEFEALDERIKEAGEAFAWVLRLYETSQERENSLFDLGEECIWEKDIPKLLKGLDDAEIKEFTFSSTWSGSNQTAWEFIKGGWSIKGMTLINTHKKWREEGYQQKPAYIFSKN